MTVREYIRNSWEKSLRKKGHRADGIPLPYPYNSPCAEGIFDEFYYWDTSVSYTHLTLPTNREV